MFLTGSSIAEGTIWGVIGLLIGGFWTFITNRNKNSKDIEIAKISSSSDHFEKESVSLKEELHSITNSYNEVREKYYKIKSKNEENEKLIKDYENLLKHYRFIFKLAYEIFKPKLKDDPEALIFLEEVRGMFSEDFKI